MGLTVGRKTANNGNISTVGHKKKLSADIFHLTVMEEINC